MVEPLLGRRRDAPLVAHGKRSVHASPRHFESRQGAKPQEKRFFVQGFATLLGLKRAVHPPLRDACRSKSHTSKYIMHYKTGYLNIG